MLEATKKQQHLLNMATDNSFKKSSKKKAYGILKQQQNAQRTTIRKVSARKASFSSNKKRVISNTGEVRKNLLTDTLDESVVSSADAALLRPTQQSLFETGDKATILANFEEWIKLATDNKINVKNSWNFALIDYFHDLSVLKENNGNINFQKASATLDGCVKIYASRIDSVVNEAGKLLSGIVTANDNNAREQNAQVNSVDADGNITMSTNSNVTGVTQEGDVVIDPQTGLPISVVNDNSSSVGSTRRRVNNRVLETTLTNFDNLKLITFDEEFSIDPLFKKALADFDEAGAKNLLLSILHVQRDARVVFDTSEETTINSEDSEEVEEVEKEEEDDVDMENGDETSASVLAPAIDLSYKSSDTSTEEELKFMDDSLLQLGSSLNILTTVNPQKKMCGSLGLIRDSIQDITKVKDLIDSIGQDFSAPEEPATNLQKAFEENAYDEGFDQLDINDASLVDDGNIQNEMDVDFDQNVDNVNTEDYEKMAEDVFAEDANKTGENESGDESSEDNFDLDFEKNLFSEFDGVFNNKAWTGKDHWKVKNIKRNVVSAAPQLNENSENLSEGQSESSKPSSVRTRKSKSKKVRAPINFSDWSTITDEFLKQGEALKFKNERSIDIPIKNRKDPYYNLLPTDYHVTLEKMTVLFTRPLQKGNFFRKPIEHRTRWTNTSADNDLNTGDNSEKADKTNEVEGEEQYWADMYEDLEAPEAPKNADDGAVNNENEGNLSLNLDMNNGLDFNDALGNDNDFIRDDLVDNKLHAATNENGLALNAGFMLSSVEMENDKKNEATTLKTLLQMNATQKVMYSRVAKKVDIKKLKDNIWRCIENQLTNLGEAETKQLKFSSVITQLKTLYTFDTLKDLSTSFCFICLLHLANEYGFRIDKDEVNLKELTIVF